MGREGGPGLRKGAGAGGQADSALGLTGEAVLHVNKYGLNGGECAIQPGDKKSHGHTRPCVGWIFLGICSLQSTWFLASQLLKWASLIYSAYLLSNLQEQVITPQFIDS